MNAPMRGRARACLTVLFIALFALCGCAQHSDPVPTLPVVPDVSLRGDAPRTVFAEVYDDSGKIPALRSLIITTLQSRGWSLAKDRESAGYVLDVRILSVVAAPWYADTGASYGSLPALFAGLAVGSGYGYGGRSGVGVGVGLGFPIYDNSVPAASTYENLYTAAAELTIGERTGGERAPTGRESHNARFAVSAVERYEVNALPVLADRLAATICTVLP